MMRLSFLLSFLLLAAACASVQPPPEESMAVGVITAEPSSQIHCPGTKMVGWEKKEDMTAQDLANYNITVTNCATKFKNSPCLKTFTTIGDGRYTAICGAPKDEPTGSK